ncbi:MAG: DNA alkylation repair protein [Deltaproteobacteria bacterium]|nr:DNA alkylation repair protein [Deltaproteobacteria bacterium]
MPKVTDTLPESFVVQIRSSLQEQSNPDQAGPMQAYMKSEMPFLGIKAPARRVVTRGLFSALRLATFEDWQEAVLNLWRQARYREERYVAIDLLAHRFYRPFRSMRALPLYEEMIVTGAWWDLVDPIAAHRLGELLTNHPAPMTKALRDWSKDPDLWKRRSSILSQIRRGSAADLDLFYFCVEGSIGDQEFFSRKAIGWALREHGKSNPGEIRRYVATHSERLSPLSRREALKNLSS